jgi:CheY-like chemotaxis protein
MDGLALAAEIRKRRDAHRLALMLFTSLGRREMDVDHIGFAAHLTKPIKPSQLFDALVGVFVDEVRVIERASTARPPTDPDLARRHPLRILLAEDNTVNQKLAVRLLKQMGYRTDVVGNGLEAIDALERQTYDVILMDVQMPEMDGLDASRQINKRWSRTERPWIVAMTANAMQGDREMCLAAGMDDYITKPIRVDELAGALQRTQPKRRNGGRGDMSDSVIDKSTIDNLRATTDAEFVAEMIDTFLEDSPQLMAEMRQALKDGNAEAFRRAAHSLKSNASSFGANELAAMAKQLEMMGKSADLNGADDLLDKLADQYAQVEKALRALQHEQS